MTKQLRPVMNLWSVEQLINPKFVAVFAALFFVAGISWTSAQAQNGNLVWAKRAGGGLTELGLGIAVDGAGNSYATGYFQTGAVFGPGEANQVTLTASGGSDIYIAKYGPDGAFAWVRQVGGAAGDIGYGIAADSAGNSYVTGYFKGIAVFGAGEPNQTSLSTVGGSDIFIAKYDTNGALVWAKRAGGTSGDVTNIEQGNAITVDSSGNVYVTGAFQNSATFGLGEANQTVLATNNALSSDVFVAKYNSAGALQWARRAGATSTTTPTLTTGNSIVVDSAGNSYVIGTFQLTTVFGPGQANQASLTAAGSSDIFIAKYDANGLLQWAKQSGGTGTDTGNSIAVDGSGNSFTTGVFQGSATFGPGEASQAILTASGISDIFLAKYNSSGLLQWVRQTGGTGIDAGAGIALDGAANIYTTGSFQLTTTFGQGEPNQTQLTAVLDDIYIAGYDSSGALKWAKRAGGNDGDLGARIAMGSGAVYVTGTFQGTATFGPGEANQTSLTGTGLGEIFVAKFEAPNCNVIGFPGVSLQSAIDAASPGAIISVSGTCNENILIRNEKQRITIDGAGAGAGTRATIDAPDDGSPVFNVRGKGILIQNLNITGGNHGVVINRGSNAVLNNNLIQNTGGVAVKVEQLSFAVLTNNAIENNPDDGVSVEENATARIGFNADSETVAGSNVIQNNGGRGIRIGNGAHARIIGNTISGNGDEGIVVERDSSADIASNNISGNQSHGIRVESNSFIMLGEDVGSSIYETPNSTSVNNGGFGIRCDDGGVLDGQQGTLNGNLGATDIRSTCVNSLI